MAAPPLPTRSNLIKMREIQAWNATEGLPSPGATAPDFCLAASRFMVGKLAGLFPANKHLNDFLKWERTTKATGLKSDQVTLAWGKFSSSSYKNFDCRKEFNETVLPAAIGWGQQGYSADDVEYVDDDPDAGDRLLAMWVPLVVGGAFSRRGAVGHYITIVTARTNTTWLVDPWDASKKAAVAQIGSGKTLNKGFQVETNAGTMYFPAGKPYVGYYRLKSTGAALTLKAVV